MQNSLALSDPKIAQNKKNSWGLQCPSYPQLQGTHYAHILSLIFSYFFPSPTLIPGTGTAVAVCQTVACRSLCHVSTDSG